MLLSGPWKRREARRDLKKWGSSGAADGASDREQFAGMVADLEHERLFKIVRELVKREHTTREPVLRQARTEDPAELTARLR